MSDPTFYLGSHMTNWLATVMVPLFVSHRRLARCRSLPRRPEGWSWALDSGGFSELSLYGGWRTSAEEYVAAVKRYDTEIGHLAFAASQDWMVEDAILAKTGLTVEDHQLRTVANFVELEQLWVKSDTGRRSESPFIPTLQGNTLDEYGRCWDMYEDAGINLGSYVLVGVGSVCRRQHTEEIREVLESLLDRDPGLPIHGFGVKGRGLKKYGPQLCSADSLAWSFNARRHEPMPGCTHKSCSNCLRWALRWRRNLLAGWCAEHGEPCDGTTVSCYWWKCGERAGQFE